MPAPPHRRGILLLTVATLLTAGLSGCLGPGAQGGDARGSPTGAGAVASDEPCQRQGWTSYEHSSARFRVCHPDDWIVKEGLMGTKVALIPPDQAEQKDFAANANVFTGPVADGEELDAYVEAARSQLEKMITDIEFESSQTVATDPPTHDLVYTGQQGVYELRWQQRIVLHEGTAYVLTYTADPSEASPAGSTVEAVFASFTPT